MTAKELVTIVRSKANSEDSLFELADLFDINIDLDLPFLKQRIQFTQHLYRLLLNSEDADFYIEMLTN